MTLTPFYSGSSGNFAVVRDGSAALAIECGVRFRLIQEALDFDLGQLDGCLITHQHGDHCRAVVPMMWSTVTCYGPQEMWNSLGLHGHRATPLVPDRTVQIGPWSVTPYEVRHDCTCFSYYIAGPSGETLWWLTDSMFSPKRVPAPTIIAAEANYSEDLIKQNAGDGTIDRSRYRRTAFAHMSVETLVKTLEFTDLSRCREIHLLHLSSANSHEQEFQGRLERKFGIPVRVAQEKP